jgi:hypothetical protein
MRKGVEADDCFSIQHAAALVGKDDLELGTDPAPDLVVEIDLPRDSCGKFEIYALLGVAEIWRYDGNRFSVFALIEGAYVEAESGLCFTFLSADRLTELIAGLAPGTHQSWRALRALVRTTKPSSL